MFFRGKDFRQDYSRLKMVCALFPSVPLLALTATANKQDREEIKEVLGLSDCVDITMMIIIFIQETNITRSVFQMVPAKH